MYYIDLPWYSFLIWVVLGLIVLLPWIAIPVIALAALVQSLFQHAPSPARSPRSLPVGSQRLGVTMADGGEKVPEKPNEDEADRS